MHSNKHGLLASQAQGGQGQEHVNLVVHARVLALLHVLLRSKYFTVVSTLIEPRLIREITAFWGPRRKRILAVKTLTFLIASTILPYGYAWSIMNYPCKMIVMKVIHFDVERDVKLGQKDCAAEDALRSPASLLVTPLALLVAGLLFAGSHILDAHCLTRVRLGERLRNLARRYVYAFVGDQLTKVKYTTSFYFNMVIGMYCILLFQLLAISLWQWSTIGALIGLAVGHFFLKLANSFFDPGTVLTAKVDGIIRDFGKDHLSSGVLTRLADVDGNTLYTNSAELGAISQLKLVVKLVEEFSKSIPIPPQGIGKHNTFRSCFPSFPEHLYTDGIATVSGNPWWNSHESCWYALDVRLGAWQTYPARFVYVGDTGEVVDVVTGKITSADQV